MLEKLGTRVNDSSLSQVESLPGVTRCRSSALSEVKGSDHNVRTSPAMTPVSRNSVVGEGEVKFSEKTESSAPLSVSVRRSRAFTLKESGPGTLN